jgi:TonB family protein
MSLAQKYRNRFAAQRGSCLITYLAMAAAFHTSLIAGGTVPWRPKEPLTLAVEPIEPIEFVYLEEATETDPNSDRRSNVDAIAAGQSKPNLPIETGKSGIEESLAENSEEKPITPLVQVPGTLGIRVPTPATAGGKAAETETAEKPDPAATPPADVPQPRQTPNFSAPTLPDLKPSNADIPGTASPGLDDSAFADLPELAPDLFSMETGDAADAHSNSATELLEQPELSESSPPTEAVLPSPSAPTSTDPTIAPFEAVLSLGREMAGLANTNRTRAGDPSVDAEQDPTLGEYLAEMNQEIERQWRRIQVEVDTTRLTRVRFTVNPLGELVEVELAQPSGLAIADEAAIQAIQTAAPFDPFPPNATQPQITRTITFNYSVR